METSHNPVWCCSNQKVFSEKCLFPDLLLFHLTINFTFLCYILELRWTKLELNSPLSIFLIKVNFNIHSFREQFQDWYYFYLRRQCPAHTTFSSIQIQFCTMCINIYSSTFHKLLSLLSIPLHSIIWQHPMLCDVKIFINDFKCYVVKISFLTSAF